MYTKRICLKSFFFIFLFSCQSQVPEAGVQDALRPEIPITESHMILGAERLEQYLPMLVGQRVSLVANQTSTLGEVHLVDTLLSLGVTISGVFSPEHGFRGTADAGEKVNSERDEKTGISLISLYGKNKKPTVEQLKDCDIIIFDIQDVGARFYTYISTLHYVMEAAAENNKTVIVLDRPNPNGHYVDGPVLKSGFNSFVGMHPIPIVHGMTIAEYAQMINGEKWLKNGVQCALKVVECLNYKRTDHYSLPIPPSPNLRSDAAIALYPSLCLFEGTVVSEGRGTDFPFEIFGHPTLPAEKYTHRFTPKSSYGSKFPKLENKTCNGLKLTEIGVKRLDQLNIDWLIEAYQDMKSHEFFITKNRWFDILAGTDELRMQIEAGKSTEEIRASWKSDLDKFRVVREKYVMYDL